MPTITLGNAFSVNMLTGDARVRFEQLTQEQFKAQLRNTDFVSAIGHEGTAQFLTQILGRNVAFNRIPVTIEPGAYLYIAQVKGRLPEGKVLSPEEMQTVPVQYWLVFQESDRR